MSKNEKIALTILSSSAIMLLPMLMRIMSGNSQPIGISNFAIMNSMISGNLQSFTPYMFFLRSLTTFFEMDILIKAMPVVLAVMNSVTLFILFTKLKIQRSIRDYTTVIYMLSPVFIIGFTTYQETAFALTLMLAGIYLLTEDRKYINALGYLCLIPIFFYGFYEGLVTLATIFAIRGIRSIDDYKKRNLIGALKYLGAFFVAISIFVNRYIPGYFSEGLSALNNSIIFDFTGQLGIGFFTLILIIISFFIMYSRTDKYRNEITLLFMTIVLIIMNTKKGLILALPMVSFIAAFAASKIINRKWAIGNLKYFTAITLLYGILFSTISAIVLLSGAAPTTETNEALDFLHDERYGIVLSDSDMYPLIKNIAQKDTFNDPISALSILNNYRRENIELIKESEIRYIMITSEMKERYWTDSNPGLLVLLSDTRAFELIYETDNINIYEVQ